MQENRERLRFSGEKMLASVIIPCYNQCNYVSESASSVFNQTHARHELILVDDGSTDDTARIFADIKAKHSERVTVLSQSNQGSSMARQAGFEKAKGDYIVFLDSDDRLEPRMLEACLDGFVRWPEASAIVGSTKIVYEKEQTKSRILENGKNIQWPSILSVNPFGACCSVMLRKRDVIEAGGVGQPGVRACEDWDLYARMARRGMAFKCIPEVLSCYLQHENVLSQNVELMLLEKIAMLDRLAKAEEPEHNGRPLLSIELYGRFRNGYVLSAFGEAVGQQFDVDALARLIGKMVYGDFQFRFFCNQFLHGLQHAMSITRARLDPTYIEEACRAVFGRFLLHGYEHYACMFLREIRREMKNPMKRYSLSRRVSRLLDPTRRFWFLAGAEPARELPCHGWTAKDCEDRVPKKTEKL
jgi:glycosyltransferase involved in cell wall biosynthesis